MTKSFDYIVVGSGCTGAMAAQTLVESGVSVGMLDVGITDSKYSSIVPDKDFLSIRRQESKQYRYLVGEEFEGISWGNVGKGEQITPPRKYIFEKTDEFLPVSSNSFSAVESLAYGGLGSGWGIGCWVWSENELTQAGLNPSKMLEAYQLILNRIGISATKDDAQNYTIGSLTGYDKSAKMDNVDANLYKNYKKKREYLNKRGFVMGRAPLALITNPKDNRKKYMYREMEYYSDNDKSAYRPWITIDSLKNKKNFTYIPKSLVISYRETKIGVSVTVLNISTKETFVYNAKKLILTAGVFGTARIVLRSQGSDKKTRLPILCNSYSYLPCIQPASLGKAAEQQKLGFANLSLFLDEDGTNSNASMASIYGYQSLMLFRMARQVPLNFRDARTLLKYLTSSLVIMGIHHPDSPASNKYIELVPDKSSPTGDKLNIHYSLSSEEVKENDRRVKKYIKAMRSMRTFPLKRFNPGNGASIHYAGSLPFSSKPKPFTLDLNGKLYGTKNVYVADGSGFTYLPAKGLTFSLMANAHIVTNGALSE